VVAADSAAIASHAVALRLMRQATADEVERASAAEA
jgi:hypothetical protein